MFGFEDRTRALLDAIWRQGSISAAARSLGMEATNARRHLRTAERRAGTTLVEARRGGKDGRNAWLTPAGRNVLRLRALVGNVQEHDPNDGVTRVRVGGRDLFVAGRHARGPAELVVPAESVALEAVAAQTSARSPRNVVLMRVESLVEESEGVMRVRLAAGSLKLESLIVRGAQRELRLRKGSRVAAVIKAVAIRVAAPTSGASIASGARPSPRRR